MEKGIDLKGIIGIVLILSATTIGAMFMDKKVPSQDEVRREIEKRDSLERAERLRVEKEKAERDSIEFIKLSKSYIGQKISKALNGEIDFRTMKRLCGWAENYSLQCVLDEISYGGLRNLETEEAVYYRNKFQKYGKNRLNKVISACNDITINWGDVETILRGSVRIGFTKEQCRLAWGAPEDINRTTTIWGTSEQWCYPSFNYLYFDNGKLSGIQN